jgi:hypothetical protein
MKTERFFLKPSNFHFDEFCISRCFDILNSVLTKNLEMNSSFFRIIYLFLIFEKFKFDRPVFQKPAPTDFSNFNKNQSVFERFFKPCLWVRKPCQDRPVQAERTCPDA